jgi:pilin
MRNALLAFAGMLAAMLVGLWIFHAVADRPTPLEHATVEADRAAVLMREDFALAASSMKVAVSDSWPSGGAMPASNAEAGIPEPPAYRGRTLRSATIGTGGAITFEFDARSGRDGGRVRLVPDLAAAQPMGVQWRCDTADFPLIGRAQPACTYVPGSYAPTGTPEVAG